MYVRLLEFSQRNHLPIGKRRPEHRYMRRGFLRIVSLEEQRHLTIRQQQASELPRLLVRCEIAFYYYIKSE